MPTRAQNVKLGLFVLASLALFTFVLVVVGGRMLLRDTSSYFVRTADSVAGLEEGSKVTMRGVPVGVVEEIMLDAEYLDGVVIRLELDEKIPVPQNARAYIALSGISGLKQVDIADGDLREGAFEPGSVIPQGPTTLDRFEDRGLRLADAAIAMIQRIDRFVWRIDRLSKDLDRERVDDIVDGVEIALAAVADAGRELEVTLSGGRGDLRRALGTADRAAGELETLLSGANRVLRANDGDLREAVRDLRQAARTFRELSRELRAQPSRLLRSPPPKERVLP